jgi:hypothetical protein
MVDGNNQTKDVVHFMMTKPIVQQIAEEYANNSSNKTNGLMTFSLVSSKNGTTPMSGNMNMSMEMSGRM